MPKPLPGGGRRLLLQGHRRRPVSERYPIPDQQWNAVIQFSARHLFCAAHASTAATTAVVAAAPSTIARTKGVGAGAGRSYVNAIVDMQFTFRTRRNITAVGDRGFFKRRLSTAAALASDPPYTSTHEHRSQRRQEPRHRPDATVSMSPSESTDSTPASLSLSTRTAFRTDRQSAVSMRDASSSDTLPSISPMSTSASSSSLTAGTATRSKSHDNHIAPWRFPTSICTDGSSNRVTDPVQSWASTSKALSQFYNSLQQLKSLSRHSKGHSSTTSTSISSSALSSALANYNFLSRLQSMHDTILVPRRDARTLFLIQGREPKTSENLEQLLMIAVDLIWLNEKDRQRRRALVALGGGKTGVVEVGPGAVGQSASAETNMGNSAGHGIHDALDQQQTISRYVHKRVDDYHGLRVSEYTILMNWIGSTSNVSKSADYCSQDTSTHTSASSLSESTKSQHGQQTHQHPDSPAEGPVGRAWAIWQDFLLTGMKPDVVLYTVLMDKFLKAKEFDRAKQIWEHMHLQDDKIVSGGIMTSIEASDPVSKTLSSSSVGAHSGSSPSSSTLTGGQRKPAALHLLDNKDRKSQPKGKQRSRGLRVVPNVQTFSVLMQTHVLNRDLQGVAQTYKELLQTAGAHHISLKPMTHNSSQPRKGLQQLGANTVLLNQVMRALIDLGEVKAAKEIYAEMKSDRDSDGPQAIVVRTNGGDSEQRDGGEDYTSDTASLSPRAISAPAASILPRKSPFSSTPLHHQAFMRRSEWKRGARRKIISSAALADLVPSSSIRPDETTHILMLDLAKREGDHELQDTILGDMDSLSST